MSETEKITVNMSVVDLGKIDMLVEEGFYSNRTDFIRAAVRGQLTTHRAAMDQITTRKAFAIGVLGYDGDSLRKKMENGEMMDIKVLGMLVLEGDITPDLALQTINSVTVRGVFNAPDDVEAALREAGRMR